MEKLDLEFKANPKNAVAMAKYMKNRFSFLGLKTPERKEQSQPLFEASKVLDMMTLRQWISNLYAREYREYQYVAIDLADKNLKKFKFEDMVFLSQFVAQKSWWDSVDSLRAVFGRYIKRHPDEKTAVFELFYQSSNMWERRVSLNLQLMEKQYTDQKMLTDAILFDRATDEFFIQKAIGWALRQYSKTDPAWVIEFLNSYQLSNLAIREASKYI